MKKQKIKCKICNKVFYDWQCRKNRRYCSRKCYYSTIKNRLLKEKITCKCKTCNKIFYVLPSRAPRQVCSIACHTPKLIYDILKIYFNNILFYSPRECEMAMNIYYQLNNKLKINNNCHISIGRYEFDFFINNTFIEVHPYNNWDMKKGITATKYYNNRRKILNKNGYKDYPLLVLQ